jgi:hypothetical protein
MGLVCLNDLPGLGSGCGQAAPLQPASGLLLTLNDFEFSTFSDAVNQTKWLEGIKDGKIFPLQEIDDEEKMDFEDSEQETSTGRLIFQFEGARRRMYKVTVPVDLHQKLRDYSFQKLRVFVVDYNNNIIGTSPDGTKLKGFKLSYFRVLKQEWATSGNGYSTNIKIQYADVNEWDRFGKYFTPTWLASDLNAITKVEATPSVMAANKFTISVNFVDKAEISGAGSLKTAAISGLVAANFQLIDQTGATLSPTTAYTATESTSTAGLYTIDATVGAMTSGSVQVIPSVTMLYKSDVETVSAT